MTPSEKKAREIRRYSMWCAMSHGHDLQEIPQGNLVGYADHLDALDDAERRGFERAKELSKQIFLKDRGFYKPWDLIKRGRVVEELENLKYEEA